MWQWWAQAGRQWGLLTTDNGTSIGGGNSDDNLAEAAAISVIAMVNELIAAVVETAKATICC